MYSNKWNKKYFWNLIADNLWSSFQQYIVVLGIIFSVLVATHGNPPKSIFVLAVCICVLILVFWEGQQYVAQQWELLSDKEKSEDLSGELSLSGKLSFSQIEVISIPITALPLIDQVETIISWSKQRLSRFVCVANAHMIVEALNNHQLLFSLNSADLVTPDGMSLVWMMRFLGLKSQDRVAGMDIFETVCRRCEQEGVSIYLLGATYTVLERMVICLRKDFPDLQVAGIESPPFRPLSDSEDSEMVARINGSGAGITFIALGCPKQELWMANHQHKINSVMIGVGAVFPIYAGVLNRAPLWIRQSGFEWAYRLLQEPRRLFGRYMKTIPKFIWLSFQQMSIKGLERRVSVEQRASVTYSKAVR